MVEDSVGRETGGRQTAQWELPPGRLGVGTEWHRTRQTCTHPVKRAPGNSAVQAPQRPTLTPSVDSPCAVLHAVSNPPVHISFTRFYQSPSWALLILSSSNHGKLHLPPGALSACNKLLHVPLGQGVISFSSRPSDLDHVERELSCLQR